MGATLENKSRFPGFISLLLVIALGISLAKLMWLVLTPPQKFVLAPQSSARSSTTQKTAINYGKLIADQHIFGEVVVKKTPVKPKAKPLAVVKPVVPKVKLKAKLHGIVAYKSRQSFALISNNNGPQEVYAKGDTLQEGVTISAILPSKVVVDNNGAKEDLLLPVKKDQKTSKRAQAQLNKSLPGAATAKPVATNNAASNQLPDLNQFRQEILANPNKLTDIVRPSPAIVNGQFVGFRIRSGKNRKLFRQLKFRANDIITEINGILLDDASKGIEVLGQLESATSLAIKVKRGNQEVFIDHSF